MKKPAIAAQLYTLRDFCKTPADIAATLKKVKDIGYDAVQLSGLGPIEPEELKTLLEKTSLDACGTHTSFERLKDDLDNVIKEHKLWGCKYVGIGAMPGEYRISREKYVEFARVASRIGGVLRENGLLLVYHNHRFEFQKFEGVAGLELLLSECDRGAVSFEIDTYWVQAGGGDPAEWIRKVKGNIKLVHFKDMAVDNQDKQIMAEVGEGNLNWPAIIDACRDAGVEYIAVEQDICQRDPFESLAISLSNLKKMGLD